MTTTDRRYSDIPPREQCVVPHMIVRRAKSDPAKTCIIFENGTTWTNADADRHMRETGAALRKLGVQKGDRVLCWLPNGPDIVKLWFGANHLGAIYTPVNTAYRGNILQHIVKLTDARVAIVHASLADRLAEIDLGTTEHVIVIGGPAPKLKGVKVHDAAALAAPVADFTEISPTEPWDAYAIIFTSGTTGPSKGVLSPHLHGWSTGAFTFAPKFTPDDRYLITLPLFHGGATLGVITALYADASLAIMDRFDTASFWDTVRRTGATMCTLLGVMATFLLKQPASPKDKDNPMRSVAMVPLTEDASIFAERFGLEVFTCYNMTEINCPLISEVNPKTLGACGKPRPGVEVRIVDEHDQPVPVGQVGEMIMRSDMPWSLNAGYWRNPEATATAWRNGWFHTGDGFRVDAEGNYYFVDRIKDAIRRRGENISSFEVEAELVAYPSVREAAAVAVRSPVGEDEVLAIVAPVAGKKIDLEDFARFLIGRMPHFMVPRYIRVVDELPKTQTAKVEKHLLRAQGLTPETWDREAAGLKLTSERFDARKQA
jgi:crotonobetaine/carnitine-CoA ligase